jgi:hypothetical protein
MSVYKVPQDVEADDKLLGPFTFRQFIYLIIVAAAIAIAYVLGSTVFVGLAIIPLPIIIFFGALALPLKKDQPMETYLAAIVSFYLKPRVRLWKPDGIESLIEITVPKKAEVHRTKDLSKDETTRRLSYLADVMDTEGWAIKGINRSPLKADVYAETLGVEDILDTTATVSSNIDQMIISSDQHHHSQLVDNMRKAIDDSHSESFSPQNTAIGHFNAPTIPLPDAVAPTPAIRPDFHRDIREHATDESRPNPLDSHLADTDGNSNVEVNKDEQNTATKQVVSDDIIKLLGNKDLSVETIAKEAHRLEHSKEDAEVYVSLR